MSNSNSANSLPRARSLSFKGIGVSPGIAVAPALLYRARVLNPPMRIIPDDEAQAEWDRYQEARILTRTQLQALRGNLGSHAEKGEEDIVDGHLLVLEDELYLAESRKGIFESHHNAEWAVRDTTAYFVKRFSEFDDEYLRERADDVADVGRRILRNLMGVIEDLPKQLNQPCIVVADMLTPSETLVLSRDIVKGVVLDRGSLTSHAALVIRTLGIPAVFGLDSISSRVVTGMQIAIDGGKGVVTLDPSENEKTRLLGAAARRQSLLETFGELRDKPAITPDGHRVRLYANIENVNDTAGLDENGAEGIGLFRTEYLWMSNGRSVSEESQTKAYQTIVERMKGRSVVIRAFDLGGDKFVSDAGLKRSETNPALGLRSIRCLLRNEEVFKTQLRAILRASKSGYVRILLPMVTQLSEFVRARQLLDECAAELQGKGIPYPIPKLGAMVEVPCAALIAPVLVAHADFISIGSNDLTQYTMAADRMNEATVHLYQPAHPAVLKLIAMTVEAAHAGGIPISLCGEMASRPLTALLLLGMRIDFLSMAPTSIPVIKALIRKVPVKEAESLTRAALEAESAEVVLAMARDLLVQYVPELLRLA